MDFNDDEHIDVCQNIEAGLRNQYELNPALTDAICIFALENSRVAIKKEFGFAKNEKVTDMEAAKGIIEWCVSIGLERIDTVNNLTLKEYLSRVEKIRKSVVRHSKSGTRSYFEFIKNYV
jgi:hypothetical protein